ncbi:GyrI-like domain-containing protein [Pedobacter sp.]|uniref:GyrI-like domain-containing protein n=1 Tax=Pedobacter sp. TaxID=1411316 RepID=UPI0031E14028
MNSIKMEPFNIIGISVRTTNENGKAVKDIAGLWGKWMSENMAEAIPNKVDGTIYSLYTDYEADHTKPYTAILGCKVTSLNYVPEGMVGRTFDGGEYVKLLAKGNLMEDLIVNKWTEIWAMDLNRAFTVDFEVFGEKAQNPADAEVDFLIAIK